MYFPILLIPLPFSLIFPLTFSDHVHSHCSPSPPFVGTTSRRTRSHPCNRRLPPNSIHRSRFCRRQGIPFPAHASLVFQENLSYILSTLPTARRCPRYLTHVGNITFPFYNIFHCFWHTIKNNVTFIPQHFLYFLLFIREVYRNWITFYFFFIHIEVF